VCSDASRHKEAFEQLRSCFFEKHGLAVDSKCKDINRLCFLSHDPELWINEEATIFDVKEAAPQHTERRTINGSSRDRVSDVELIVSQIEHRKIDITATYDDWLILGFALSHQFAEEGRIYFHRLSCFHQEYERAKTDKQYTYCLKNNKEGITINSFFYVAKKYGMSINTKNGKEIKEKENGQVAHTSKTDNKNTVFYSPKFDNRQNVVDVIINYTKLNELLLSFGFRRFDVEADFIIVKVEKNVVEKVNVTTVQDSLFNYLDSLRQQLENGITREMLIEKFNKSPETYFSKKRFSLLRPQKPYQFVKDTKDHCYVFYQNGYVECSADGWHLKEYKDLDGFIWKNQIHEREFTFCNLDVKDIETLGDFAKFVFNISGGNDERFCSLRSLIGYCLHTYFEEKLKAIILTDSKISDAPEGRTGKSLLLTGLSKIKKLCNINGKNFEAHNKFKYQEADLDDQVITIDDVPRNFDFEMMFNDITEGIKVEKKNLIPFMIRAKMLITTNRTLKIEGASAKDRSVEFEFADHYDENFSPLDEFKKWFFGLDFTESDWIFFDNFMMSCISHYLRNGIINPLPINLNRRKLLESTNSDFVEFMDTKVLSGDIRPGEEYEKHELHTLFLSEYSEYSEKKYALSQLRNFTQYLKLYAKYTPGFAEIRREDERKSNEKRYIRFRSDKEGL